MARYEHSDTLTTDAFFLIKVKNSPLQHISTYQNMLAQNSSYGTSRSCGSDIGMAPKFVLHWILKNR